MEIPIPVEAADTFHGAWAWWVAGWVFQSSFELISLMIRWLRSAGPRGGSDS